MDMVILRYTADSGWSTEQFPPLDSHNTLIIAFGSSNHVLIEGALDELTTHYPLSSIVGCSTAGEILDDELFDDGLAVAILRFATSRITSAIAPCNNPDDSYKAAQYLAGTLNSEDLKAVFVLSEGLKVNGSRLVAGLTDCLDDKVTITGGLAADGDRFQQTWVYADHRIQPGHVVAVGLYGHHIQVNHGSQGGWDIFGVERTVTRAEGNVLYELDGQPALALYKKYLGERAKELPASGLLFPLALRAPDDDGQEQVVRTILGIDEEAQSITFAGDILNGHRAQLMRANFDRLIDGASNAANVIGLSNQELPILCIAISCVGRRLVLGERSEEELEATLEHLPPGTRQIGFYAYGEISPLASGQCDLHNQTMTLTTISELS
jgi:hypothetical protein